MTWTHHDKIINLPSPNTHFHRTDHEHVLLMMIARRRVDVSVNGCWGAPGLTSEAGWSSCLGSINQWKMTGFSQLHALVRTQFIIFCNMKPVRELQDTTDTKLNEWCEKGRIELLFIFMTHQWFPLTDRWRSAEAYTTNRRRVEVRERRTFSNVPLSTSACVTHNLNMLCVSQNERSVDGSPSHTHSLVRTLSPQKHFLPCAWMAMDTPPGLTWVRSWSVNRCNSRGLKQFWHLLLLKKFAWNFLQGFSLAADMLFGRSWSAGDAGLGSDDNPPLGSYSAADKARALGRIFGCPWAGFKSDGPLVRLAVLNRRFPMNNAVPWRQPSHHSASDGCVSARGLRPQSGVPRERANILLARQRDPRTNNQVAHGAKTTRVHSYRLVIRLPCEGPKRQGKVQLTACSSLPVAAFSPGGVGPVLRLARWANAQTG